MKSLLAYLFIILGLGLMTSVNAAGNLQGFLNAIENSKESGFTIDLDSTAKEYDYKNFKGFVKDYKKEYEKYHSTPEQRANRSKRVLARRQLEKDGRVCKGDGKDVDHKDGNPQNNDSGNLRVLSAKKNRGRDNNKWRK